MSEQADLYSVHCTGETLSLPKDTVFIGIEARYGQQELTESTTLVVERFCAIEAGIFKVAF